MLIMCDVAVGNSNITFEDAVGLVLEEKQEYYERVGCGFLCD